MSDEQFGYVVDMGAWEREPKPTRARVALSANLKFLMANHQDSPFGERGISADEIERRTGGEIQARTVRRACNQFSDSGPTLETIDDLARFFRVETYELLRPNPLRAAALISGTEKPTPAKPINSTAAPQQKRRIKPTRS